MFFSIFLVETIVPKEAKKQQETLVLNSDGTTQKFVHKSKVSRSTVSQEKHVKQDKQFKQLVKQEKQEKHEKVERSEKSSKSEKTVQNVEAPEPSDKPRLGRPLTSQEESILLPLLQGLLAANGNDTLLKTKQDTTSSQENESSASTKNSRSGSLANNSEKGAYCFSDFLFLFL